MFLSASVLTWTLHPDFSLDSPLLCACARGKRNWHAGFGLLLSVQQISMTTVVMATLEWPVCNRQLFSPRNSSIFIVSRWPVPTAAPQHRWRHTTTTGRWSEQCTRRASHQTEQWWSGKKNREWLVRWILIHASISTYTPQIEAAFIQPRFQSFW